MEFLDGADSYAYTTFVFPQNYDLGTITFRYIWFRENDEATPESKTVEFDMDAVSLSNFDAIGGTAYGTAISLSDTTDSSAAENKFMESAFSSALTIAGTPADGDVISLRIMRDDDQGTMTGSAYLVGVMIEYTIDAGTSTG
jgi:type 1 fimbria pilin